ncbi:unnamed protein product [Clonostachys chloroleuca]|uniref:Uncharacterized protein n=1 Tax=Clonostachys chloroleuca TaxID=1926264 RepID=A0AA35Q125_9HYPO|nr:unnamed protein product [Clonostachys chloroleuca]
MTQKEYSRALVSLPDLTGSVKWAIELTKLRSPNYSKDIVGISRRHAESFCHHCMYSYTSLQAIITDQDKWLGSSRSADDTSGTTG